MSFHKRYISNSKVISTFKNMGIDEVLNLYTKGIDSIVAEIGLASDINYIIYEYENKSQKKGKIKNKIEKQINKHFT